MLEAISTGVPSSCVRSMEHACVQAPGLGANLVSVLLKTISIHWICRAADSFSGMVPLQVPPSLQLLNMICDGSRGAWKVMVLASCPSTYQLVDPGVQSMRYVAHSLHLARFGSVTLRVAAGMSPAAFHDGWLVNCTRLVGSLVRISRSASCTDASAPLMPGRYVNMAVMAPLAPRVRACIRMDTNRYPVDRDSISADVWNLGRRAVRMTMYVWEAAPGSVLRSM